MALVGFWGALVVLGILQEGRGTPAPETCLFHRLVGHPCPTCGSTRVVLGFAQGSWGEALRLNPLVAVGLVLTGLWLGSRLLTGRALRLEASPRERTLLLLGGLVLLALNWLWVWRVQS